jgi:cobalt-precorrin 5A hydrolase
MGRPETVGANTMIVAGIGCRSGCGADEIVSLIDEAVKRAGIANCRFTALAVPAFKTDEAGLREAAERLSLPLLPIGEEALKAMQSHCPTHSDKSLETTGFSSVAEAAALAAAGAGGRLVLPRIASARATCALAERDPGEEIRR